MKTKSLQSSGRRTAASNGFLQFDLVMGLAILTIAVMPLGFSFARERQALRTGYQHSVLNELVDGEMEILAAGAARNLPDGPQNLPVQSRAMDRLPAGHFQLVKSGNRLQLTWTPDQKCGLSAIAREATLK